MQGELAVPLLEARRERSGDRPAADRRDDLTASRRPNGISKSVDVFALAARGLVGRRAMSVRTGRNYQFNAAGNAITAGLMGLAGQYFATSAIFFGAAALCIPALTALSRIRAEEIDYARVS
jgi:hypothetical protein